MMWAGYRKLTFVNAFRFDGDYTTEEVNELVSEFIQNGGVKEDKSRLVWYVKSLKLNEEYIFIKTSEEIKSKSGLVTVFRPVSTLS